MRIYRHYNELPDDHRRGAIAIGNFDGVHRGHCEVINRAGEYAHEQGVPWGVLTFEPHPRMVFNKGEPPFRLTPFHTKARHIENMGVEFLVVVHFDGEFAKMTADDFIAQVLVQGFAASYVVSGFDFEFGFKRGGNMDLLKSKGSQYGFGTDAIKQVLDEEGEIISSTRIRQYLNDEQPGEAARLLGRRYEIEGRVAQGDKRGRTIGFPTANIELDTNTRPAIGVYAIQAGIDRGPDTVWHDGVANLGYRPTFDGDKCVLEAHLFDFDEDIYGAHLRVALVEFIRPEQKFDGIEGLTAQIEKDCSRSKEILAGKND
ncbi:MAG: bifunctional riboflavin kinase/FAD synthetase [Rhodospirillaceae bacterium]|mgnify:FL=1|jgi:riboflavin kinase / FMN adenylyltransferase|nr:bifunctional riboflavin kinase/FAD synthetase [Rhodospirillaceae bacterium]MBT4588871.1 bifunctional riboflavin kinase/FAD synthetase [Rhodospirillaceae bacterium]MBT7269012.1 bifunctional riboflavin kinase/FAD synthetase [Rhodospirillaceae bacterium]